SRSTDGAGLAYRTVSPRENVFVMRSDGTGRRRLTDDEFRNRGPQWIRGSDWVLFYSNRAGSYALWMMRSDGTELRRITDQDQNILQPHVTRDGSRIALNLSRGLPVLGVARIEEDWFARGR